MTTKVLGVTLLLVARLFSTPQDHYNGMLKENIDKEGGEVDLRHDPSAR
jgi:hypothetical protein